MAGIIARHGGGKVSQTGHAGVRRDDPGSAACCEAQPRQGCYPAARAHPSAARSGVLLALLAALGFSTLGILGKLSGPAGLPALAALPWRFGLVALLLLPLGRRLNWTLSRATRGRMLGVGLLYCLATHAYFLALGRVSAGTTSLLLYLAPAFVLLYLTLAGNRPGRMQLGASPSR